MLCFCAFSDFLIIQVCFVVFRVNSSSPRSCLGGGSRGGLLDLLGLGLLVALAVLARALLALSATLGLAVLLGLPLGVPVARTSVTATAATTTSTATATTVTAARNGSSVSQPLASGRPGYVVALMSPVCRGTGELRRGDRASHQPVLVGVRRSRGARPDVELGEDVREVPRDGLLAEREVGSDLGVAVT